MRAGHYFGNHSPVTNDLKDMECARIREAWSALIDGEEPGLPRSAIDEHLRSCAACREFADDAWRVDDEMPRSVEHRPFAVVRYGLVAVAAAQLAMAVPGLIFGTDEGAPIHIAHEVGAWDLALAVGFLFAAARPLRAVGMLPFAAALSTGFVLTAVVDIANGRQPALFELPHLLELAGTMLLWFLTSPRPRRVLRVV
jgi:predicted anti-sigma-YlaC factor YlaD